MAPLHEVRDPQAMEELILRWGVLQQVWMLCGEARPYRIDPI